MNAGDRLVYVCNNERRGLRKFTFDEKFSLYKQEKKVAFATLFLISAEHSHQHFQRVGNNVEGFGSRADEVENGVVFFLVARGFIGQDDFLDGVENSVAVERSRIGEVVPTVHADTVFLFRDGDIEHFENVIHLFPFVIVAMFLCGLIPYLQ